MRQSAKRTDKPAAWRRTGKLLVLTLTLLALAVALALALPTGGSTYIGNSAMPSLHSGPDLLEFLALQRAELTPSYGTFQDFFGCSVALSGDTALVGAAFTGESQGGGAYIFTRSGAGWSQQAELERVWCSIWRPVRSLGGARRRHRLGQCSLQDGR